MHCADILHDDTNIAAGNQMHLLESTNVAVYNRFSLGDAKLKAPWKAFSHHVQHFSRYHFHDMLNSLVK